MIQTALDYISEGFGALPLYADKSPMLKTGHPYLYETIKDDIAEQLFLKAEKIGIACGEVSHGFICLDFDAHKGQDIRKIFNEFLRNEAVKSIVTSNNLPIFKTPNNGYHIYFKTDDLKAKGHAISKWEDGDVMIEVRGHGQYVCLYPSEGYKQLGGSEIIKVATISIEERDLMFSVAESFNQLIKLQEPGKKGSGKWPTKFDTSKPIGKFNEIEVEYTKGLLIDAGWKFVRIRPTDKVELWLRPGKEEEINGSMKHSATFGMYHNMFYSYTEADTGFTSWTPYTLFDIMRVLKFEGNYEKALEFVSERYAQKININEVPDTEEIESIIENNKLSFPVDVFPTSLQTFINQLNDTLNYSRDFLSLSAMFTVATLNGNCYKLKVKNGWTAPSVFWFSILGEPGTMKTHPVSMMIHPLNNIDKHSKWEFDNQMNDFEMMGEKEKKSLKKPKFKQILISDYTLEALHGIHDFNKRGVGLYKDELVGFLNDMNKYRKGSDEQFWLESFNNRSYIVNRVTKDPLYIDNININIIGTIQPIELNKIILNYGANGLTDRFLYSRSEREIYPLSRKEIDESWIMWWNNSIEKVNSFFTYTCVEDTKMLTMTPEALELFYQIDERLIEIQRKDNITSNMKGYINKMKTYLPRFALLMALFDMIFNGIALEITIGHMQRAEKIMIYFMESAKFIFNESESCMEIAQVNHAMSGKTKKEKIIALHLKGFKNVQISKELNVAPSNVSAILKSESEKQKL
jgi:hypothetical protein